MTTYKRRQTDTIEATQFTSELGGIVRGVTAGAYPDGLEHSEHSGYSYHGQRVCFGDYLVGGMVVEKAAFEKQWELATAEAPTPAEVRAALEKLSGLTHGTGATSLTADHVVPSTDNPLASKSETLIEHAIAARGTTGSVAVDTVLAGKAKQRGKRTEPGA